MIFQIVLYLLASAFLAWAMYIIVVYGSACILGAYDAIQRDDYQDRVEARKKQ